MIEVATSSFEDRLEEVFRRAMPKLAPQARAQLAAFVSRPSLMIMAGVLVAWVASHAIGIGEIVDVIVAAVGVVAIGYSVFSGLDHLYDFAAGTYRARSESELDKAADNLAKAVAILGIQAVLAVLFRGAKLPQSGKRGRIPLPPPPVSPGFRYKPTIRIDPSLPAGAGSTSYWGDVVISALGSAVDRALALRHELVHQFLSPKLFLLREYRAGSLAGSYVRSSLWRYLEEAVAETVAQVGEFGFSKFFVGVRFPVKNGYMYLTRGGGFDPDFGGAGAIPEAAALLYTGLISSMSFQLWFVPTNPQPSK